MYNAEDTPTTFGIWSEALESIYAKRKAYLGVALKGAFIPFFLFTLFFSAYADTIAQNIDATKIFDIMTLSAAVHSFLLIFLAGTTLLIFALIGTFLSFMHLCNAQDLSANAALKIGFSNALPRGVLVFLASCAFSLERLFIGSFYGVSYRIFSIFILMAAAIIVVDRRRALSALKSALFFRYCSPKTGGAFSCILTLLGVSTMVFACELVVETGHNLIINLDEILNLPRTFWANKIPFLPFSGASLLAKLYYSVGNLLILALLASCLVTLYKRVCARYPFHS